MNATATTTTTEALECPTCGRTTYWCKGHDQVRGEVRTAPDAIQQAVENKALDLFFGKHHCYPETDAQWRIVDDMKFEVRVGYRWDEEEERLARK